MHWTVENNWKNIMFTDEMMIHIKPDGKIFENCILKFYFLTP